MPATLAPGSRDLCVNTRIQGRDCVEEFEESRRQGLSCHARSGDHLKVCDGQVGLLCVCIFTDTRLWVRVDATDNSPLPND